MKYQSLIRQAQKFVQSELGSETTGHDYWHSYRVWKLAKYIGTQEGADLLTVELAALLHDIGDWKLAGGDRELGPRKIREWLEEQGLDESRRKHVVSIVYSMSYLGGGVQEAELSLEGKVVQDADRLEALGALGIARAFATGQKFGQPLYDPDVKPLIAADLDVYQQQYSGKRKNTTINHFYEKLLLLKNRMKTSIGRRMAQERHEYMEQFLRRFFSEWNLEEIEKKKE